MLRTCSAAFALIVGLIIPVIAAPAKAGGYSLLYAFQGDSPHGVIDGDGPLAGLLNVSGKLYGTTNNGGTHGFGTVFSLDPVSGVEEIVYSFQGGNDGYYPQAGVNKVGGNLYGTTQGGGPQGYGTVFSVVLKSGLETVVHQFGNGNDSYYPEASLINVNGTLYGTTAGGPSHGAVYYVKPPMGEGAVYSFQGVPDGSTPAASLINVNGVFYGTTVRGGASNDGSVFSVKPTGAESVLHSFGDTPDGALPAGSLSSVGSMLYGTTANGGTSNYGTIFSVDTRTGAEKVLYSFKGGTDGYEPEAGLVELGGKLYGTTLYGGFKGSSFLCMLGCGTVFSIDLASGAEKVVYAFKGGSDGTTPKATMIKVAGRLYGTTEYGGGSNNCNYGCGTVFEFVP